MPLDKAIMIAFALAAAILLPDVAQAQTRLSKTEYMFLYVDKDSDGRLSPDEFQMIITPSVARGAFKVRHDRIPSAFREADRNDDGFVDLEELKSWLNKAD